MRRLWQGLLLTFVILWVQVGWAGQGLSIASFNIQNLGWGDKKDFAALGRIAGGFDLVAVQEVMDLAAVDRLVRSVEQATGEDWESVSSHLIGAGRYREAYSFIYRTSRVALHEGTGQAAVFLDTKNLFIREPFSARFVDLSTQDELVLATVHIKYGKSIADRLPEIQALASEYWLWLTEVYGSTPLLLLGDFNLPPSHPGFAALRQLGAEPLITEGATTISTIEGRFANLYDNIFWNPRSGLKLRTAGIFDFPAFLGVSHTVAREQISDHVPVFVTTHQRQLQHPNMSAGVSNSPVSAAEEAQHTTSLPVIGNRNSRVYHLPSGCPSYNRVGEQNRQYFSTAAEAEAAGFRKAGNCR